MKYLVLGLLLVSSVSLAEMKPAGTFVPSMCSQSPGVWSVCFGSKVSVEGRYLSLARKGRKQVVYRIDYEGPGNGGVAPGGHNNSKIMYLVSLSGQKLTLFGYADKGVYTSVYGQLSDGTEISVSDFRIALHTM